MIFIFENCLVRRISEIGGMGIWLCCIAADITIGFSQILNRSYQPRNDSIDDNNKELHRRWLTHKELWILRQNTHSYTTFTLILYPSIKQYNVPERNTGADFDKGYRGTAAWVTNSHFECCTRTHIVTLLLIIIVCPSIKQSTPERNTGAQI